MTQHTHESDKELWAEAHAGATAYTLKPGEMLSARERAWAQERVRRFEEADERDRRR